MKYSFVFVLCVASLVLQCTCRPQGVPEIPAPTVTEAPSVPAASSSPPAETIMTDVETPTEVSNAGEQVVFDDTPASGSSQDDESAGVTTDMPPRSAEEMQMDDAVTTMTPTDVVVDEISESINTNLPTSDGGDAPAAPSSSDDDAEAGTTASPSSSD